MRILALTHRVPYAPNRGDRIRAWHLLRSLSQWAEVDLVALAHDAEEAAQTAPLDALGIRTSVVRVPHLVNHLRAALALAGSTPLTHHLLRTPALQSVVTRLLLEHPPDVVLAYGSGMAGPALEPPLAGRPLVIDFVDVDSDKWRALADGRRGPMRAVYAREARTLRAFEARAMRAARTTLVVNDRERQLALAIAPDAEVRAVENGIDAAHFAPQGPPSPAPVVVFTGVMNYAPNADAAEWLARAVWPAVRRARPDAVLQVVGASPTARVRALASPQNGIVVTGTVPDVRPSLWQAALGVAPLRVARGVQNKVLEGLAAGLPMVVTPEVAGGLPPEARAGCAVCADAEAWTAQLLEWLALTPDARRALAVRARLDTCGWEARLAAVRPILEAAAGSAASASIARR